jgi:hypothetical protein
LHFWRFGGEEGIIGAVILISGVRRNWDGSIEPQSYEALNHRVTETRRMSAGAQG